MSVLLLVMATVLFLLLVIPCLAVGIADKFWLPFAICAPLCVIFTTWFIAFQCQDWRVEKVSVLQSFEENGRQVISYKRTDNEIILLNLNEKFKKNIKTGTSVKMTEYSDGPYVGIYLTGTVFSKRKDFQLEE